MPADDSMSVTTALALLGLSKPTDFAAVDDHYRAYVLRNHPDRGGSHDAMVRGNLARAFLMACSEQELKSRRTVAARHSDHLTEREVEFYTAYVEDILRTQRTSTPQRHPSSCMCGECDNEKHTYDRPFSQEKFDAWARHHRRVTRIRNVVLVVAAVALTIMAAFALWSVDSYGDGLIYDLKWRVDVAVQDVLERFSAALQN